MGEAVEAGCGGLTLSSGFHDQVSQPFALGQANTGELEAELFTVDPAHNGLIDTERPLEIRKKQGQFQDHPDRHVDR